MPKVAEHDLEEPRYRSKPRRRHPLSQFERWFVKRCMRATAEGEPFASRGDWYEEATTNYQPWPWPDDTLPRPPRG